MLKLVYLYKPKCILLSKHVYHINSNASVKFSLSDKGQTINHPGGPRNDGPIFFAEIFSSNKNCWNKSWPYFFKNFYHYTPNGKNNLRLDFFFRAKVQTNFFHFRTTPWMINGPPLNLNGCSCLVKTSLLHKFKCFCQNYSLSDRPKMHAPVKTSLIL